MGVNVVPFSKMLTSALYPLSIWRIIVSLFAILALVPPGVNSYSGKIILAPTEGSSMQVFCLIVILKVVSGEVTLTAGAGGVTEPDIVNEKICDIKVVSTEAIVRSRSALVSHAKVVSRGAITTVSG